MKIIILYNEKRTNDESEAEFDTPDTINSIKNSLEVNGHEVCCIEESCKLKKLLDAINDADLIFNMAEGKIGKHREAFYPSFLERLGLPYVSSDPLVMALAADKQRAKEFIVGTGLGIDVPEGHVIIDPNTFSQPGWLFPLIIKPNYEGSSKGITQSSVVENAEQFAAAGPALLAKYPDGVLVEQYIDGLDVSVPFVEGMPGFMNEYEGVLAPCIYRYNSTGKHAIYDLSLKRSGQNLVQAEVPPRVNEELIRAILSDAAGVFHSFGVKDYARVDFRLDSDGNIWFLELNPLPSLAPGDDAEIYKAAALAGFNQDKLIGHIIDNAMKRYRKGSNERNYRVFW